jgi:hypothetical protein
VHREQHDLFSMSYLCLVSAVVSVSSSNPAGTGTPVLQTKPVQTQSSMAHHLLLMGLTEVEVSQTAKPLSRNPTNYTRSGEEAFLKDCLY